MKTPKVKSAEDMDFQEFVHWATEYVVDCFLSEGLKGIRSGIRTIVECAALNTVFGGKRKSNV